MRAFRFGFQIRQASADELRDVARRAEAAGFDVLHTWDHVVDGWAPLALLLVAADCTTRLRVCRWCSTTTSTTRSTWRGSRPASTT